MWIFQILGFIVRVLLLDGDELPGSFMEFMMEESSVNVAHVERFEPIPPVVLVTILKPRHIQPNSKPKRVQKKCCCCCFYIGR